MINLKYFSLTILLLFSFTRIGLANYAKTTDGIIVEKQAGKIKLRVITDRIIQVTKSPQSTFPGRKSLSEVENLKCEADFSATEDPDEIILTTSELVVKLHVRTGSLAFFDRAGNTLLQELPDGSIMETANVPGDTAWTVEQQFVSPEDEAIYGLGQYQYDILNWKNGFMQMQQKNTAIAMPVIVSNQGYGMFWHNYSLTTFNPDIDTLQMKSINEKTLAVTYRPASSGIYTFIMRKDEWFPVELSVDDSVIYGHYGAVSYPWVVARAQLEANRDYEIKIEKLDKPIYPTIRSGYLIPADNRSGQHGLKGEYFSNMNFEGSPEFVRVDSVIDFNWENGSPVPDFPIDQFTIRWTGKLVAPKTQQHISLDFTSDDGVRLFINGVKVIDDWRDRAPETNSYMMDIEQGQEYDIKIEYFENGGGASARLAWSAQESEGAAELQNMMKLFCRPPEKANVMAFRSDVADAIDYYFLYGPEPDQITAGMRRITGKAPLYPKWVYGLHMCQYGWKTQEKIESVIDGYRQRKIPVDVVVQDMDYWRTYPDNQWGSHKFDSTRYPNPAGMITHVHEQNAHLVISVWPRINKCTDTYGMMQAKGYLLGVQDTRGKAGEGIHIDDSPNAAYDPFSVGARSLFWQLMNDRLFTMGVDGWWMDASEPEWGYDFSKAHTAMGTGRRYLNAYPLMSKKGVYEGWRSTDSQKRPYILTRSAFPGQQRYAAAVWSGDVAGDWVTYRKQIPAGLNYCITGTPYWTIDIGGFKDFITEGYDELLVRWFQYGTFLPIQRVHGVRETEFQNYLAETQDMLLKFTNLRYRLLPYIYSLAAMVTFNDFNIHRALVMDFRSDVNVLNIKDQFMFGRDILVCPVVEQGAVSRTVYLPQTAGGWYNFWTGINHNAGQNIQTAAPLDIIPLFVKGGSIIPMGPFLQYSTEKPADPIELRVYPGANGSFQLYEDENDNFNYEKGVYSIIPFEWNEEKQTLTIGKRQGKFSGMLMKRMFRIVWVDQNHGVGLVPETKVDKEILYNGQEIRVRK